MLKLKLPSYPYIQSIDTCLEGITGDPELLSNIINNKIQLREGDVIYTASASTGELCSINPLIHNKGEDPAVIGGLKKWIWFHFIILIFQNQINQLGVFMIQ